MPSLDLRVFFAEVWPLLWPTLLLCACIYAILRLEVWGLHRLELWRNSEKEGLTQTALRLVDAGRLASRLGWLLGAFCWLLIGIACLAYLTYLLERNQETREFGESIIRVGFQPFQQIGQSIIGYIPNFFQVIAILVVTRYMMILVQRFFQQVGAGKIRLGGFHAEWADPTGKLVRFLLFALALVAVFPYLPGSQSPAFQTISVFFGVLLSLGSSSVISNITSGIILLYMRTLRVGDWVKIGESFGQVIARGLLVSRLRTPKNEIVSIPNSLLLTSQIVNYSSLASGEGLIVHTGFTIGYNTPWPAVHAAMLDAARRTPGILVSPSPFILQTALNDYHVSYELNAYTRDVFRLPALYSDLHRHLQDACAEAGIEILSPMFHALRNSQAGDALPNKSQP